MENIEVSRRGLLKGSAALALTAPTLLAQPASASPSASSAHAHATTPAELEAAINAAAPGDTITMKNGVWPNVVIRIDDPARHGTEQARITLRAETGGQVILTGSSKLSIGRDYWIVDGLSFLDGNSTKGVPVISFGFNAGETPPHHSELTNCRMQNFGSDTDPSYSWVIISGTDNTVSHCYFTSKRNPSDMVTGDYSTPTPRRHHIHHNYFGDIPGSGSTNGWDAFCTGTGADTSGLGVDNMVIEHNLFRNCSGESETVSVKSSHNVVRHNTFVECGGNVSLRVGNGTDVQANYFFCNHIRGRRASAWYGSGGVRVSGEDHRIYDNYIADAYGAGVIAQNMWYPTPNTGYPQVRNLQVVYNTIVGFLDAGIIIGWPYNNGVDNTPPDGVVIANNIVSSFAGTCVDHMAGTGIRYTANIAFGPEIGLDPAPAGVVVADPALAAEVVNGYQVLRPRGGSPAIRAASGDFPFVDEDIEGTHRPRQHGTIGAYERLHHRVVYPPLDRTDVGPDYMRLP